MSNILVGVTGGVAAYKSVILARLFIKSGHNVRVMMTDNAQKFVTPLTFEALTGAKPLTNGSDGWALGHIEFASWADICVVAPATANIIGKLSAGIADDCVSTTLLALDVPLVIAPAMNSNMYKHPAVQNNIERLKSFSIFVMDVAKGELACKEQGEGRMKEPEEIFAFVTQILDDSPVDKPKPEQEPAQDIQVKSEPPKIEPIKSEVASSLKVNKMVESFKEQSVGDYLDEPYSEEDNIEGLPTATGKVLEGIRILVTAGPTREYIDPVRFITNRSSGKMGYAIAQEAKNMGAKVTLISGGVSINSNFPDAIRVETSLEMYESVMKHIGNADIIIMAAAVSDYMPQEVSEQKIKKNEETMSIPFVKTKDILHEIGKNKSSRQILVGFAAETENIKENALRKLSSKNLDIVVANDVSRKDIGFDSEYNEATLYFKDGHAADTGKYSKTHIAKIILAESAILLNKLHL